MFHSRLLSLSRSLPSARLLCSRSLARPDAVARQPVRFLRTRPGAGETTTATTTLAPAQRLSALPRSKLLLAGGAAAGVFLLGLAGQAATSFDAKTAVSVAWTPAVRQRVRDTFANLGLGIGVTAVSAGLVFRSGLVQRIAMMGWPGTIGMFVLTIGSAYAVQAVPPADSGLKMGAFLAFNGLMGATLSPVVYLGGALVLRAAAITGGIVGSLSYVAANSPSDQFLYMGGPLAMGLGAVVVSSLGAAIFPAAAVAPLLHNISLYGGLGLFSAFVLYDTSRIVDHAKTRPTFDPMGESVGLYLDAINIFVRIVQILAMQQGGSRRK
eukprot:m.10907 g.10907  ORF g.10907 m.10907 type:complete len:325 (+) comp6167_c0_seq1:39-1013(+)